jgi:glycosyltransferase involved in cell wall biosynthesis
MDGLNGARILNVMLAGGRGGVEAMGRRFHDALTLAGAQVLSVGEGDGWFAGTFPGGPHFAALKPMGPGDPFAAWRLGRIARRFGAQLVIVHNNRPLSLAISPFARLQAPVAMVAHNFLFNRAAARTDLVIAVSASVGAAVREKHPNTDCTVVENFGPLARQAVKAGPSAIPVIGTLGRLHVNKGYDLLIQAAAALRDGGRAFELRIGGEGPERANLEGLVTRLRLDDCVRLPGWTDDTDGFLGACDLFVSSSRVEPFGLVVAEAMAAGRPVVATDIEGPRDILDRGRLGVLVTPGDATALAHGLAKVLDDWPGALERARVAQTEALTRYSLQAGAERLTRALAPLVARGREA